MIKHIVFWRLKASAHGNDKLTNARIIKQKVEGLRGRIPGLLAIDLGIDTSATDTAGDIVLYSEFANQAALDAYQAHPEHQAIVPFVREAQSERRMIDYEA
jgi:quinol monooxygenase YgiN